MNELTKPPMPFADMAHLARAIAQSGLFGMKTPEQALALMAIAQAEGTHPALAARDYDVIQGKPAKKAEAMMRDFIAAGGKVEWHQLDDAVADATFTHPQTGSVRIDWDIERAQVAGFAGKDNWKKFPRAMLRSRVVSEGVRTVWPLATSGMHVPEEVADYAPRKDDHTGPTIEAEVPSSPRDAINAEIPLKAVAAATPRPTRKWETPSDQQPERPRTRRQFIDGLRASLRDATTAEEVDRLVCAEDVMRAKGTWTGALLDELNQLIADALKRWYHAPPDEGADDQAVTEAEEPVA